MPKSKKSKRAKQRKAKNLPQMMSPIPKAPESLLDGKTFVFNQYVPILAPLDAGAPVAVEFNTSPNGYEYKLSVYGQTPTTFGQLWGEALQQFAPLSLLYETYTILDVSVQVTPCYPGFIYGVTPGFWAIQTAESRTNFTNAFELASQLNATLVQPLKTTGRSLNYQPYLQQNEPAPYLLTYDANTGGRQLFGVSTSATVTPLITHYQEFTPFFSLTGQEVPIAVYKLTAKVHFRGRQNTIFTPQQVSDLMAPKVKQRPLSVVKQQLATNAVAAILGNRGKPA